MTTALNIATQVARLSVADPDVLGHAGLHTNIADYAKITRYLTPSATAYLTNYARDAYRNATTRASVSGLALVAYRSGKTPAESTRGKFIVLPPFDSPFKVITVETHVSASVGLDTANRMIVTGYASSRIPATQRGTHYVDTLSERFTYYITDVASPLAPVGIDGWYGYANATDKPS